MPNTVFMLVVASIICLVSCVLIPMWHGMKEHEAKVYQERLREFRLRYVQRHYQPLRSLTWREIESEYPVPVLYDKLPFSADN